MNLVCEKIHVADVEENLGDEERDVFSDLMGNELQNASDMASELAGPTVSLGRLMSEAVSWGPYVTLLYKSKKDPVSIAAATVLFLQSRGVKVDVLKVKEYYDAAVGREVVAQAGGLVEMFTAAVSMLSSAILGTQTAELVQKTNLWSSAMRVAHWLILGPFHLMLGGVGGVQKLTEYYDYVFPSGVGAVSVIASLTVLFKAIWDYGLPILTGKMTVSEAMANNQTFNWLVECQEAIHNSSDYDWLQKKGYLCETTQALTVEFEQYVASLRSQGKLHASAYVSTNTTLFNQVVTMEKQMSMLAMRVRALRTGIENKVQPVCIVLLSVPGCQKSTYQQMILRMVWSCLYPGMPFDNSMVASVNPAAARLDNVNGQTRIIVIDDAAQYSLEYTKNPIVANPMNFVNTVPTMLDQAEISRKGTEMMNHKAVLINSNSRTMQLLRINTCPAAAFRRIWRTLVIAPKEGENVGKHAAGSVFSLEELNSLYDFSVEKYVCEGNTIKVMNVFSEEIKCEIRKDATAEAVNIKPNESRKLNECIKYLKKELVSYLDVQNKVVTQKEGLLASTICEECGNLEQLCLCKTLIASESVVLERTADDGAVMPDEIVEDDGSGAIVPQMHVSGKVVETAMTLASVAALVGASYLVGKKVGPRVRELCDKVDTLLATSAAATISIAELAQESRVAVRRTELYLNQLKKSLREKAVGGLNAAVKIGCAVLVVGCIFVGVRRFFFRAVGSQAMDAYEALGMVPALNTHTWPKGAYSAYVVNPADPNSLRSKLPMNKVLSVLEKARCNLVRLSVFVSDMKARSMYGLALGPGRVLTLYHLFKGLQGVRMMNIVDRPKGGLSNSRSVMVNLADDIFQVGNKDYCIVAVGTSYYYPVDCFPTKESKVKDLEVKADLYRFDPETLEDVVGVSHLNCEERPNAMEMVSHGYSYTALKPYGTGTCGTIISTSTLGAPYIVGLHSMGQDNGSYGWCEVLYKEEVEEAMRAMDAGNSSQAGLRYSETINGQVREEVGDPHSRTIFQHVAGFGAYIGNFRTLRTTDMASTFERTPLFDKVVAETNMKLDVPNLKARIEDGDTYVDPLLRAAALNSSAPGSIDPVLQQRCFDNYFEHLEAVPGFDWKNVGFLSLHQSLNGEPAAVNSMNFASAAGPWVGKKKRDHVLGEPGEYTLDDKMKSEIDGILNQWNNGLFANILYNTKVKDEPRNRDKVPRSFYAGPFSETVLTRMLYGGFFDYTKKFIGKTEHAVGINCCDSDMWGELIEALGGLDGKVTALDASDFDITNQVASEVQWQVHQRQAKAHGWTVDEWVYRNKRDIHLGMQDHTGLTVGSNAEPSDADRWMHRQSGVVAEFNNKFLFVYQRCLALEQKFFLRSYRGEIVGQRANQPSGRSYTSEINSVCTSVYERMYYYSSARLLFDLPDWETTFKQFNFNRDIVMRNYGDDFVFKIRDTAKWYTFELRQAIATNLGMKYSMPDKKSALRELPLREVDFLKRGFGRINDRWVAPLELASVLKSFAFFRKSGSLTRRQAMVEAALNAHAQLYMHGREEYDRVSLLIRGWLESLRGHSDYGNVVDDVYPVEPKGLGYDKLLELHKKGEYNEITSGVAPTPQSGLDDFSLSSLKNIEMSLSQGMGGMPDYAATQGAPLANGVGDSGVPRSVLNNVEQPATVTIPEPLAVHHEGHGTIHGTSLASHKDSLEEFLSRPVVIATCATTTGSATNTKPWASFLLNSYVNQKIRAFGYIRGTLHIRFLMSASQFVQGRVFVAYNPGGTSDDQTFDRSSTYTALSHLPYAGYIDPGIANDVEWSIPYHEARPYTPIEEVDELGGRLYVKTVVPYENVNTGTPSGTLIQVMVWMTDVELRVAASPQSSTGGSTMSKALLAASGGLKAAAALVGAKTVSSAFHAVGDMASAFGFTREIDTRDHMPSRLRTTAGWAATEGAENSYPLTADPLAEKTVATDYSVGIQEDELVIAKMASRYSYVGTVEWTEASTTLGQFYVTPSAAGGSCVAFATFPFAYWRGSMRFKFSAVRTMFHKGKILIKWSPGIKAVDISLNTGYSVIWDLDATPEVEILVPYNKESYWCKTGALEPTNANEANGYLSLYVLEVLTGPTITTIVPIQIFMAGGPDLAVSCPTLASMHPLGFGVTPDGIFTEANGTTPFPPKGSDGTPDPLFPQMGEEDFGTAPNSFVLGPMSSSSDAALRSMGEQVVSFREILKRKVCARKLIVSNTTARFITTYPKSALGIVSYPTSSGTYTVSPFENNLMSYLMPMFLGVSGTTKWDLVVTGAAVSHLKAVRGFGHAQMNYTITDNMDEGSYQGEAYARTDLDGVLSVVSPQYIRDQFTYVSEYYQDKYLQASTATGTAASQTRDNGFFLSSAGANTSVSAFVAAGDDFNLIYFLGPPPTTYIEG